MKRRVEDWSVDKLYAFRSQLAFPEYQRQPNLWSVDRKRLLIDSILKDIDIPKLYFNEPADGNVEVVDGQQRLWAIWDFLDEKYGYLTEDKQERVFSKLTPKQRKSIERYELQVTIFEDAADDYLRELFLRLQLGLLLVTGEKLHAAAGKMKTFIFKDIAGHPFMRKLRIPKRRYAKETLGAQISINSFGREKTGMFQRTRYEDLLAFLREYSDPQGQDQVFFKSQSKKILATLDGLWSCFGARTTELANRSYVLSVYLFFESQQGIDTKSAQKQFVDFVFTLWKRLRQEAKAGIERKNKELYAFQTLLSSAPGERYQIERRHEKLDEFFTHFKRTKAIAGD